MKTIGQIAYEAMNARVRLLYPIDSDSAQYFIDTWESISSAARDDWEFVGHAVQETVLDKIEQAIASPENTP